MDKVKVALALLKKHHFWVMTGMVVLLSFIGWFLGASQLWADYRKEREKIEAKFKALTALNSGERENQTWIDSLEKQTGELKKKVRIAWADVYAKQKKEVYIWPKVGTEDNQKYLEKLGPKDPIKLPVRRAYQTYIRNEFARLLKIVDARDEHWGRDKPGANEPAEAPDHDYLVHWNPKDQQEIYAKFTSWTTTPKSEEVRETQEDLWVYHALLRIIADLNQNSTGPYNAKVKEIENLLIGSEAADRFEENMAEGRLERPAGAPAAVMRSPGLQLAASSGVTTGKPGRYVDEKGMPFTDPSTMPAEFKRMPIVMRLVMDQREILRLLIGCANSPLPVEVRHLHVHPKVPVKAADNQQRNAEKEIISYDMDVELDGVIYIFNPPDQTKLGEAAAPDAGGAPAAEPPSPDPNGGKPDAGTPPAAADAPRAPAENENQPGPAAPGKAADEPAAPAEPADMEKTDSEKTDMEKTDE